MDYFVKQWVLNESPNAVTVLDEEGVSLSGQDQTIDSGTKEKPIKKFYRKATAEDLRRLHEIMPNVVGKRESPFKAATTEK